MDPKETYKQAWRYDTKSDKGANTMQYLTASADAVESADKEYFPPITDMIAISDYDDNEDKIDRCLKMVVDQGSWEDLQDLADFFKITVFPPDKKRWKECNRTLIEKYQDQEAFELMVDHYYYDRSSTKGLVRLLKYKSLVRTIDAHYKKYLIDAVVSLDEKELDEEIAEIVCNLDLDDIRSGDQRVPAVLKLLQRACHSRLEDFDLHFKYAPGGDGAKEAKKAKKCFFKKISNKTS